VTLRTRFCNTGENTSRLRSTTYLHGTHSAELDAEQIDATTDPDISVDESSLDEVTCAICKLRNGRAAGPDGIPPELLKCAINPMSKALHEIFIQVWRTGHVLSDWKDGILLALYKGKGPKVDCSSYRPITLLSVPGKVFAHVLLARIQPLIYLTRRRNSPVLSLAVPQSMPYWHCAYCQNYIESSIAH